MSDFGNYFMRHQRLRNQPIFIMNHEEQYVIVEGSKENKEKFEHLLNEVDPLNGFEIIYKPKEEFKEIQEKFERKVQRDKEIERQRKINNPQIDKDILAVNSKDELIDYLLDEYLSKEKELEWEYSNDFDVSSAEINANYNKLKELADEYREETK